MKILKPLVIAVISLLFFCTIGCEKKGPAEKLGESVDEAVEDTQDTIEDAVDSTDDSLEETGEKIDEALGSDK